MPVSAPDLTTRIRSYLSRCPPAVSGQGGHNRTFGVCCSVINGFALSEPEAFAFLSEWNLGCQPPWSEHELLHKIRHALAVSHQQPWGHLLVNGEREKLHVKPVTAVKPPPKWPLLKLIADTGRGLAALWESSPMGMSDHRRTEEFLDLLFPGNPLLCLGSSSDVFSTRPREQWRGRSETMQFIVPSPMSKVSGKTKDGRDSQHCLDNTGPRRYIVVEFDDGSSDLQAATLLHLSHFAPLVMAVHSGGKSVHGWFYCADWEQDRISRFFRYACSVGADEHLWVRSQFVRVPDGTRANGRVQSVFYFNRVI
jgi:hypothetical protein